jgi:hypothetical protein
MLSQFPKKKQNNSEMASNSALLILVSEKQSLKHRSLEIVDNINTMLAE